jgi:TIR domain
MADVFLSYSSKDRPAAEAVERALTARGIEVFWDQETPPGVDWDTWIRSKLTNAKTSVVLWSKTSVKSPNVRHEAIVSRDANKFVPVMVDNLTPEDFPMGLYMVQAINLTDWRTPTSKGMARLIAEVEARIGRPSGVPGAKPPAAPQPKFSLIGVLAGLVLVGGGSAWMWWAQQPKTPSANPATGATISDTLAATACAGGAPPVLGVCPSDASTPPAPPLGPTPDGFSTKLIGHWRFDAQMLCTKGTTVSWQAGQLIFSTPGDLDFVHAIQSDSASETRTQVLSPDREKGHLYRFAPKPVQPNAPDAFTLVVEDQTTGKRNEWTPCVVKQ